MIRAPTRRNPDGSRATRPPLRTATGRSSVVTSAADRRPGDQVREPPRRACRPGPPSPCTRRRRSSRNGSRRAAPCRAGHRSQLVCDELVRVDPAVGRVRDPTPASSAHRKTAIPVPLGSAILRTVSAGQPGPALLHRPLAVEQVPRGRCRCPRSSRSSRRRSSSRAPRSGRRRGRPGGRPRNSGRGPRERAVVGRLHDRDPHLRLGQLRHTGDPAAGQDGPRADELDDIGPAKSAAGRGRERRSAWSRRRSGDRQGSGCRAQGRHSPTAPGRRDVRPAQSIRGPSSSPVSMVSRSAQSMNARNVPRSRTVVKPDSSVTRALRTDRSSLLGRCRGGRHARGLDLTHEVAVGVDEPGQDGQPGQVDHGMPSGRPSSRDCGRVHQGMEDAVGERRAGLDIEEAAGRIASGPVESAKVRSGHENGRPGARRRDRPRIDGAMTPPDPPTACRSPATPRPTA